MTFAAVTKILKACIAAVILNYSGKREKKKLIYFSERKNNQALKAVHPLQDGSNATEEYGTRIQDIKSYPYRSKNRRKRIHNSQRKSPPPPFWKERRVRNSVLQE